MIECLFQVVLEGTMIKVFSYSEQESVGPCPAHTHTFQISLPGFSISETCKKAGFW